jgi:type I restriction enzyme S subunit
MNDTGLPRGWAVACLDDICIIKDGRRIPVNQDDRAQRIAGKGASELFPYYGATGVIGWIDGYIFEGEHVLLGEDGAPFYDRSKAVAYVAKGRYWVNNHAHVLQALICPHFLCHYLNQFDYHGFVTGTTRLKLNQTAMRSMPILVAPLVEQRAIVAKIEQLFSELEKGVEQLQTVKQQLKQYRQAVLKAAFEGKLTAEWRAEQQAAGDLPGADELLEQIEKEREKRYQQQLQEWKREVAHWEAVEGSNSALKRPKKPASKGQCIPLSAEETASLPGLPRGWTWLRLGQIIASGIQNGLYKPQSAYGAGIPIVRINDFQNGWIRPVGELLQVRVSEEEHSLYSLHRGDVLINRVNSITHLGKCMLVPQSYESTIFESNIMRFSLLESAHAEFLCYYLQSRRGRDRLISNAKWAVNQASINQSDVASTPVPFPSLDEQRLVINEIQRRFSILDELERAVDHGLQHAEGLRQSILKKAFEGRLLSDAELAAVRNDPEYEPADKLLERIRAEKEKDKQSLRSSRAGSMRRETRRGSLRRPQEETNETASEAR